MKKLNSLLYIVAFILLSSLSYSCTVSGLTNGYAQLSSENKSKVKFVGNDDKLFDKYKNSDEHILMINASQLKELLPDDKKTLVYLFFPTCSSPACIPPKLFIDYCKDKGYNHIIVNLFLHSNVFIHKTKMFGIDDKYYNSRITFCYIDDFIKDLIGTSEPSGIILFEGKTLVDKAYDINNIQNN